MHHSVKSVSEKVAAFFSQFHLHTYKKGTLIIQPNDKIHGAHYLEKGFIRQFGISSQGIEISFHIFTPRSFFPMTWIIADIENHYYYEALTDVKLYIAPKKEVLRFLKQNQDVLFDLTKRILLGLDKLTTRIEFLTIGSAYDRVVSILLYLSRHFGKVNNNVITIDNKFTHRDIGALAGLSRETTSREWKKLEKKGVLQYHDQRISIMNIELLRQELQTR